MAQYKKKSDWQAEYERLLNQDPGALTIKEMRQAIQNYYEVEDQVKDKSEIRVALYVLQTSITPIERAFLEKKYGKGTLKSSQEWEKIAKQEGLL